MDLNSDGQVDGQDMTLFIERWTNEELATIDFNNDGKVDSADYYLIYREING